MYVLVVTKKKRKILFLLMGVVLILIGMLQFVRVLMPGSEVSLGHRLSLKFPVSVEVSAIYSTEPGQPYIQASSTLGKNLKTETIKRHGLSEITFQYPETIRMGEIQNLGHEVTVHINFKHSNNKMIGFFQVWNLNQSLEELLNNSKKMSSLTFTEFNESKLKIQGMNAILWECVFVTKTQDIKGVEIFIENGSEMYRFSMFVPKSDYKPVYKRIIMRMAKSLKIRDMIGAILLLDYTPLNQGSVVHGCASATQFFPLSFAI